MGRKKEVYGTTVALKEKGSPTCYGSKLIVLPLHVVSHSSQLGEIPESFSLRDPWGSSPKPRQAQSEQVAQGCVQSHFVLKASKDGEPPVLLGSLCGGHKKEQGMRGKREEGKEERKEEKGNEEDSK